MYIFACFFRYIKHKLVIKSYHSSFNFLVSMLYTQLFQQLFENADNRKKKRLPVPVHFLMDEFANVSLPDDFGKILSVMRSREVSVSIILQNLAQIKALFEKEWESITGNCDSLVYLGGTEQSTHKYISELLGKETIDFHTYNQSYGMRGSYSKNSQLQGRELMTPDEVRMLDNRYALAFIRGARPVKDLKYDLMKHPNIKWTSDGGYAEYKHGSAAGARLSLWLERLDPNEQYVDVSLNAETAGYVLMSEEDIEKEYEKKENADNEKS
ncbi:MAG: TraM recognition domain-containing protein [Erysipelotrichaceae bacterium]|nr:TraM recognition domain-containing protein [Erysipelotrichaceae bacterium]